MNLDISPSYLTRFFKAFYVVLESFESLPAANLFCWLKNECEITQLEDKKGPYIYRSRQEVSSQFRSLSPYQVDQAMKLLEQEHLIIRDRQQYGFRFRIHPDADQVIQAKWEEWQAIKQQKLSSQNLKIETSQATQNHKKKGKRTPQSSKIETTHSNQNSNFETAQKESQSSRNETTLKVISQNFNSKSSDNAKSQSSKIYNSDENQSSKIYNSAPGQNPKIYNSAPKTLYKELANLEEQGSYKELAKRNIVRENRSSAEPFNSESKPVEARTRVDDPPRFASEPSCPLNAGDDYREELSPEELDYQDRQERDRKEADQYFDSLPDEWFQQKEDQLQKDMKAYQAIKADYPDYPTCPVSREHSYESVPWEELGNPEETPSVSDDTCQDFTNFELEERISAPQEEPMALKLKQPNSAAKEEMPQANSHPTHSEVQADKESNSDSPKPDSVKAPSSQKQTKPTKKKSSGKRKKKSGSKRLSKDKKEELLRNFAGEDTVLLDVLHSWVDIRLGKRAVESAGAYQRQFNLINECAREAKVSRAALVNHMVNKEWKGCYALDSNYAIENCKKEWKLYCRVHELSYTDTVEWTMPVETPMWEYVSESGMKDDDLLQTPWYKLKPSEKARVNYLEDHPEMLITRRGLPIQKEKLDQCRKRRWEPKPEPAAYSGDDVLPF